MASWNAIAQSHRPTIDGVVDPREPAIGNGRNEFGWVESSDSPTSFRAFLARRLHLRHGRRVMGEADTTCNAMVFPWPDNLFGLYTETT